MLPFEFIVDGPPVSQQARRRDRIDAWKETVRNAAKHYWPLGGEPVSADVQLKVTYFYLSTDIDNIVKPIQDAMNGLVYLDDRQITDLIVRKRDLTATLHITRSTPILEEGIAKEHEFLFIEIALAPDPTIID